VNPTLTLGWRGRVALILFGIAFALALVEGGLRLAGALLGGGVAVEYLTSEASYITEMRYKRDETYEAYARSDGLRPRRRVLVMGDSFANGGNAFSNQTYPYYLHRYFEEAGDNVGVLNMGKCESSTFGVAERLERYLDAAKPDELPTVVAFIVGSADKYNLNADIPPEAYPTVDVDWFDVQSTWYQDLRLYKLYRHIKLGLSSRSLTDPFGPRELVTDEAFARFRAFYAEFKSNADHHGWQHAPDSESMPEAFAAENERIKRDFAELAPTYFSVTVMADLATAEELLNAVTIALAVLYASKTRHADAVGLLLEVERDFPQAFWAGSQLFYARYNLFQLYQLQSKYTADDILPQLERTRAAHPHLALVERFSQLHETLSNGELIDALVDERRLAAWDRIVSLCRAKGIRVLLQNYPSDYRSANGMIAQVAQKYDLPLIDHHALFAGPSEEHGRNRYLEDDDHCTPEGYEMMAKAVYDRIKEEGFLEWFPALDR